MKKNSFKCQNGVGRQHTTFTSSQNAACSNEYFLWRVDYSHDTHFLRLLLFLVCMICPLMQEHFL